MVTNMLYGGPFRDMRLLQEEVNRLAQSAAAPQAAFPAINVYAHQDGIVITAEFPASNRTTSKSQFTAIR